MSSVDPVKIFICYAQKDDKHVEELETHLSLLRRQKLIDIWHHRCIIPGSEQENQIDDQLRAADLVLLLVSPSFMATDYCFDQEMAQAMKQHQSRRSRVVPILVRPVDITGAPFAQLAPLPRDGRPISAWGQADEAWFEVSKGIRQVVESIQKSAAQPPKVDAVPPPSPSPGVQRQPTAASLRQVINQVFRTSSDLDAFCLDNFRSVYQRFSSGMDRVSRVNLLLEVVEGSEILKALSDVPDFARYKDLINFK